MDWIRLRLCKWLGIESLNASSLSLSRELASLRTELQTERNWRIQFVESLREKAKQPSILPKPRYTDYESSQVAVLQEFEKEQ